jgi:hypothetical protein
MDNLAITTRHDRLKDAAVAHNSVKLTSRRLRNHKISAIGKSQVGCRRKETRLFGPSSRRPRFRGPANKETASKALDIIIDSLFASSSHSGTSDCLRYLSKSPGWLLLD